MTSFSELGLPPAIAEAIALKKFETATPVQAAVMNPELKGRDLLVSSQTGSGKTLAFGAVLARELLSDEAHPKTRVPRALVIAPTRELATQVRGELAWLFAKTGWRMGVFTGGTDIWGDLRTLKSGVDVVVGTPGRLVDLVTREALPLGTVEAVVLDEADEMLDMGFREDLEKLLGAASSRRLSLLFSATLPADILGLAKRYQKNAVRIDTKASGAASHADIHYDAYLTAPGEKFPAVMNILRMHDVKRAIVFGTTRDGVASLHEALVARGVKAVVLSGERSQADRNRALATLKRGEASVLVATNVAARGLDLPEVDLVIHADLPSNVEALTHRSGRTGRAGRKGTSVIVAQLTERRKAERLLSMARLQAPWQAPPDANAVAARAEEHLVATLGKELGVPGLTDANEDGDEDESVDSSPEGAENTDGADGEGRPRAARKSPPARDQRAEARVEGFLARFGEVDREALLRALVGRELSRLPSGDRVSPVHVPGPGAPRDQGGQTMAERRARFASGTAVFRINIGQRQNAEPGWLLPLICRRGGVTRKEVGAIRLGPHATEFEIASDAAEAFARAAAQPDPRAPDVRIERASGAPAAYGAGAGHGARRSTASSASSSSATSTAVRPSRAKPAPRPAREEGEVAEDRVPSAQARATAPAVEAERVASPEVDAESTSTPRHTKTKAAAKHEAAPSASEEASSPARAEAPAAEEAATPVKRPTAARKRESAPEDEAPLPKARRAAAEPSPRSTAGAKTFGAKPFGAKPFGAKPFGESRSGDKPFARKPFGAKPFGRDAGPREPFGAKPSFGRKPYERGGFDDKPARPSFEGTRPSFARGGSSDAPRPRTTGGAYAGEKFGAARLGGRFGDKPGASSGLRGGDRPVSRTRTAAPVKTGRSRPGPTGR